VHSNAERFSTINPQLLQDSSFVEKEYWTTNDDSAVSYKNDTVTINSSVANSRHIKQSLTVNAPAYLKFSMEAGAKGLIPSDLKWAGAQATVIMYDDQEERIASGKLFQFKTSTAIRGYSRFIYAPEGVKRIDAVVGVYRSDGELIFHSPVLALLAEKNSYKALWVITVICWVLLGALTLLYLMKRLRKIWALVTIIGAGALMSGVLSTESSITHLSSVIAESLPDSFLGVLHWMITSIYGSNVVTGLSAEVSKLGHFATFLALGCVLGWELRKISVVFAIVFILAVAFATEALQILVNYRSSSLKDIYVDLSGGGTGIVIGLIFHFLFDRVAHCLTHFFVAFRR